jgi:DNA-binding HxlR family transcriptional regulator
LSVPEISKWQALILRHLAANGPKDPDHIPYAATRDGVAYGVGYVYSANVVRPLKPLVAAGLVEQVERWVSDAPMGVRQTQKAKSKIIGYILTAKGRGLLKALNEVWPEGGPEVAEVSA